MRGLSRTAIALALATITGAFFGVAPASAVTAVIMGGTGQPDPAQVPGYLGAVSRLYIAPVTDCQVGSCDLHPTVTPEEFFPLFTSGMTFGKSVEAGVPLLDTAVRQLLGAGEHVVVFGYSQSATLVTDEKRALAADPTVNPAQLQYVVIGNPNRPNGGFLQRFYPSPIPVFEYTPTTSPVDTAGPRTVDISFQYDIASDFPAYPLNALTMLNTLLGNWIHGSYPSSHDGYSEDELLAAIADPVNQQTIGNTTYITVPTKVLPLAQAIRDTGYTLGLSAIALPLADLLEPTLRVLVELGYDRTVPPGTQTSFGMFPAIDPGKLATELFTAAGQGVHDAVAGIIERATPPAPPPAPTAITRDIDDDPPATPAGHGETATAGCSHASAALDTADQPDSDSDIADANTAIANSDTGQATDTADGAEDTDDDAEHLANDPAHQHDSSDNGTATDLDKVTTTDTDTAAATHTAETGSAPATPSAA